MCLKIIKSKFFYLKEATKNTLKGLNSLLSYLLGCAWCTCERRKAIIGLIQRDEGRAHFHLSSCHTVVESSNHPAKMIKSSIF
jgi:hypothetical protein